MPTQGAFVVCDAAFAHGPSLAHFSLLSSLEEISALLFLSSLLPFLGLSGSRDHD